MRITLSHPEIFANLVESEFGFKFQRPVKGISTDSRKIKEYDLYISAKTGDNIQKLKKLIYTTLVNSETPADTLLTSKRQYVAIKNTLKHLEDARSLIVFGDSLELVVEDINRSIGFLDSITSKTTKDDILDAVFSSFCVGK